VTARVSQRVLALAAFGLLAALAAIAVVEGRAAEEPVTVVGAIAPGGGWYDALAAPRPEAGDAARTECGLILTTRSQGVTHPVLPCGAKLLIRFGDVTVLTEVIDNQLASAGRQFELTGRLARRIGLEGTQAIEWRYAAGT